MIQLICRDLTLGYEGVPVVRDLNFSVSSGDYLCIVGDNGSGKSTLIKTIVALHKPLSGSVALCGIKRTDAGYLPQQTDIQKDFPASVYEVVLSGFLSRIGWRPFYSRKEKAAALDTLERLEIADLSTRCYRELSGGQQQRVLLARALCGANRLLFLDEPAAGLDTHAAAGMYDILCRLNREDGVTVVMVSHDMDWTLSCASHILHIGKGGHFFGTALAYGEWRAEDKAASSGECTHEHH